MKSHRAVETFKDMFSTWSVSESTFVQSGYRGDFAFFSLAKKWTLRSSLNFRNQKLAKNYISLNRFVNIPVSFKYTRNLANIVGFKDLAVG